MKKKIKELLTNVFMKLLIHFDKFYINKSFSQEGEDLILKGVFGKKKKGFFIDIGAHHPKRFSNTYLLYKKGWHGVNIDAAPGSMQPFKRIRKRDINLEVGISDKKSIFKFFIFNEPALSTFSEDLANSRLTEASYIKKIVEIKTFTLEEILDQHKINNNIDFMNLDCEGFDYNILLSNNWKKYRPKLVLVEVVDFDIENYKDNNISKLMFDNNYEFFAKTNNTVFFKDKNAGLFKDKFSDYLWV